MTISKFCICVVALIIMVFSISNQAYSQSKAGPQSNQVQNAAPSAQGSSMDHQLSGQLPRPALSDGSVIKPSSNTTKISIPKITITNDKGPNIDASDTTAVMTYNIQSNTNNHKQFNLMIKKLQVSNSPIPIDGSLNFSSAVDDVNLQVIRTLTELLKVMRSDSATNADQKRIFQQIQQLLPQIVTNTSKIKIDFLFNTAKGEIVANLQAVYPPTIPLPNNVDNLMKNAQTSILIRVSSALLDSYLQNPKEQEKQKTPIASEQDSLMLQQMFSGIFKSYLDHLLQQGYVIKDKDDYVFMMTTGNGVIKINGRSIELDQQKSKTTPTSNTTIFSPAGTYPLPTHPSSSGVVNNLK